MIKTVAVFSGFSVDSLEKAEEFYTKKLNLKLANKTMGLSYELPGGGKMFVYQKDDHQPAAFTILNFVVNDIDEAVDELVKSGINMEIYENMPAPQDKKGIARGLSTNMGPDIAWFKDPAGNILSVLQDEKYNK